MCKLQFSLIHLVRRIQTSLFVFLALFLPQCFLSCSSKRDTDSGKGLISENKTNYQTFVELDPYQNKPIRENYASPEEPFRRDIYDPHEYSSQSFLYFSLSSV